MRKKQIVVLNYFCLRMLRNIQFWSKTNLFSGVCSTNINAMYCALFNLIVLPFFHNWIGMFRFSYDFSLFSFTVSIQINIVKDWALIWLILDANLSDVEPIPLFVTNQSHSFSTYCLSLLMYLLLLSDAEWRMKNRI